MMCDCAIWTADIGAEYGDIRPLDEARIRKLAVNGIQLLDRMDPNLEFVTELATAGSITWLQREHIIEIVHRRDRNDKLLEFITRRSVLDFNNFIKVLSKEQEHLVPFLVTDGGETFCDLCEQEFIIIKNECHSSIIVDRLQGCGHSKKLREGVSHAAVKSFVRMLEQLLPVTCTLKLKFKSSNSENYNNAFSLDELTDAISKSHDTAVGPDDIHYHMLKHFPVDPLLTLLNILNSILASGNSFQVGIPLQLYRYLNSVKIHLILPQLLLKVIVTVTKFFKVWHF